MRAADRPPVMVDPHPRRVAEIFSATLVGTTLGAVPALPARSDAA